MSLAKKEKRAAKRAAREEKQGKSLVMYIVGTLILLFVILFAAYAIL